MLFDSAKKFEFYSEMRSLYLSAKELDKDVPTYKEWCKMYDIDINDVDTWWYGLGEHSYRNYLEKHTYID